MASLLIVDDDVDFAESLAEIFTMLGHLTRVCHSGREAVAVLSTNRFDVVLIDFKLPDGPGTTWLERIDEVAPSVRKLMITGYVAEGVAERCQALGVEELLLKPLSVRKLAERLFPPA